MNTITSMGEFPIQPRQARLRENMPDELKAGSMLKDKQGQEEGVCVCSWERGMK